MSADTPPIPDEKPEIPPLDHHIDMAARTVWGEARGESEAGQLAVAHVIWNRARIASDWKARGRRHPLYGPGHVEGVVKAPWQFSCWNENDPNRPKMLALSREALLPFKAIVRRAHAAAEDPTHGATHYHTRSISPPWARGLTPCAEIGHHLFYNNVP